MICLCICIYLWFVYIIMYQRLPLSFTHNWFIRIIFSIAPFKTLYLNLQGRELEGDEECAAGLHPPGGRDGWRGGGALEPVLGGGGTEPAGPASRWRSLRPPQSRRSRPSPPGTSGYLRHALQATSLHNFYTHSDAMCAAIILAKKTCLAVRPYTFTALYRKFYEW